MKTKVYLSDFISNSNEANIRFFIKNQEYHYKSEIQKVNVKFINKTTRTGFNCELILQFDEKRFVINDNYDWTLKQMKELFLFVKDNKNEKLTSEDKHYLYHIEKKINK